MADHHSDNRAENRVSGVAAVGRPIRLVCLSAAWLWLVVVGALAVVPSGNLVFGRVDPSGGLAHIVAFAVFSGLLFLGLARPANVVQRGAVVLGLAFVLGGAVELGQLSADGRSVSLADVALDVLGAAGGVVAVAMALSVVGADRRAAALLLVLAGVLVAALVTRPEPLTIDLECPERPRTARSESRTDAPPIASYVFDGVTDLVEDRSGALDLEIDRAADHFVASSRDAATEVAQAVAATNEVTIASWFTPAVLPQDGPARIVTISNSPGFVDVNIHLGVEERGASIRVRTDCDRANWSIAPNVLVENRLHHLVATYRAGWIEAWLDGRQVLSRPVRVGLLDNWDENYRLHVGNEADGTRPFDGTVSAVALYDRALSAEAIEALFDAGPTGGS